MSTTLYAALATASHRPTLLPFKHRCYLVNGWDAMRVWDGIATSDQTAGIAGPSIEATDWTPTPTQSVAGDVTAGPHLVRYRYMDSRTRYVSNHSNVVEITAPGSMEMTFTIESPAAGDATKIQASADAKVDTIILEMATSGGEQYYLAAEVANTAASVTIDISDEALVEEDITYPESGNGVPPVFKHLVSFKDRLFGFGQVRHADGTASVAIATTTVTGVGSAWTAAVAGRWIQFAGEALAYEIASFTSATSLELKTAHTAGIAAGTGYVIFSRDNQVYFSQAGYPESWRSATLSFEAVGEEEVTACVPLGNGLILFGQTHLERFTYADTPEATGYKRPIAGERGALNQWVVVVVDHVLYAMDRLGWYLFEGGTPQPISRPVDRTARAEIDYDYASAFHAVYYPKIRSIRWFVVVSGSTPKRYYEYQIDHKVWTTGELDVAQECSGLLPRGAGREPSLGDENGHQWWDDVGTTMGGDASVSHAVAANGCTTTRVNVEGGGLPTAGLGLQGVAAYHAELDELQVIASNDADKFVVAAAFSRVVAQGEKVYLGRIVSKLKTFKITAPRFVEKLEGIQLWLHFEPQSSARRLRVRIYRDGSAAAHSEWKGAVAAAGKLAAEGVTVPADGETDWLVDLQAPAIGLRKVPIGFKPTTLLEVELEVDEPDTALRLYAYEITGVPREVLF